MHLDLPHLIFSGPPIDDEPIFSRLPAELQSALRSRNGCVAYLGALHVRGACAAPGWHSLRSAIEGPAAFPALYPQVHETDLPFAEDAYGDQFLLRDGAVYRLEAETGTVEPLAPSLDAFFSRLLTNPGDVLGFEPVDALAMVGGKLEPGELVSVYPPFSLDSEGKGRSLRPIDALEQRGWLADFARQIRDLPDGSTIQVRPAE